MEFGRLLLVSNTICPLLGLGRSVARQVDERGGGRGGEAERPGGDAQRTWGRVRDRGRVGVGVRVRVASGDAQRTGDAEA